MGAMLARVLRAVAQWLEPRDAVAVPAFPAGLREAARGLALKAEAFEAGTSGEFKRAWVYGKLCKAFPGAKRAAALAIELELP